MKWGILFEKFISSNSRLNNIGMSVPLYLSVQYPSKAVHR